MLKRITLLIFILTVDFGACQKWEPAIRIGDFGFFFKAHVCFDHPEYCMSAICFAKLWNTAYCTEVCMIKTAPHGTVSPQMWSRKSIKGWFTRPQTCWRVSMGLTDRRKTAKNLVDSRKKWKILTVSRK